MCKNAQASAACLRVLELDQGEILRRKNSVICVGKLSLDDQPETIGYFRNTNNCCRTERQYGQKWRRRLTPTPSNWLWGRRWPQCVVLATGNSSRWKPKYSWDGDSSVY